jgi:hypothetical protein
MRSHWWWREQENSNITKREDGERLAVLCWKKEMADDFEISDVLKNTRM